MAYYDKKSTRIWAHPQVDTVTPILAAGFAPVDVIAAFEPQFSYNNTPETIEYAGDPTTRDTETTITDRQAEIGFSTFVPVIGTVAAAPTVANYPLAALFSMAKASTVLSGTGATAQAKVSNDVPAEVYGTFLVEAQSASDITKQKLYRFYNGVVMADLALEIGQRPKLKWTAKATPVDAVQPPQAFPEEITAIVPNTQGQKVNLPPTLKAASVTQAELVVFNSLGYNSGANDLPTPLTGTVKNICFSKLNATNVFGFKFDRVQLSCFDNYSVTTEANEVTLTILEEEVGAVWLPDAFFFNAVNGMLQQHFALAISCGTAAGKKLTFQWSKLQLTDVKNSEVANYKAKDLTFKCNGTFTIVTG